MDRDQLFQALRAAHNAGDTSGAARIARMIEGGAAAPMASMRPVARPAPTPQLMPTMPTDPHTAQSAPLMPAPVLPVAGSPPPAVIPPPDLGAGTSLADLLEIAVPGSSRENTPIPPQAMPDNPVLQTGGPGAGGGMEQLYDQGILPRRYTENMYVEGPMANEPDPFVDESLGDLFTRRGQEFVQGGSGVIESIMRGVGQRGVAQDMRQADDAAAVRDGMRQEMINDLAEALQSPDLSDEQRAFMEGNLADLIEGQGALTEMSEAEITPLKDRPSAEMAEDLSGWVDENFGVPPQDDSFWSMLMSGAGSAAAFVLPAILTRGSTAGLAVSGQMGSDSARMEAYDGAIQGGATPEQANQAAQFAGLMGYSEALPIAAALRFMPPKLQGQMSGRLGRILSAMVVNSGEEAAQEAMMAIGQNLIAKGIYDPERDIINREVGMQALVGAILGFGMGGGTQSVREIQDSMSDPLGNVMQQFANQIEGSENTVPAAEIARQYLATPQDAPIEQRTAPVMPDMVEPDTSPFAQAEPPVVTPEEAPTPEEPDDQTSEAPVPETQVTEAVPAENVPVDQQGSDAATASPEQVAARTPFEQVEWRDNSKGVQGYIEQRSDIPGGAMSFYGDDTQINAEISGKGIPFQSQAFDSEADARAWLGEVYTAAQQQWQAATPQEPVTTGGKIGEQGTTIESDPVAQGIGEQNTGGRGEPVSGDNTDGAGQPVADGRTATGTARPAVAEGAAGKVVGSTGEGRSVLPKPPEDYDKTWTKVRQGGSRNPANMTADQRATLREQAAQILATDGAIEWHRTTAEKLIKSLDEADKIEGNLSAAQAELDKLAAEIEARNEKSGSRPPPKMAEAQFNKDMDEIAAEVANLKEKYGLDDDDALTFDYRFRRETGTTRYRGKKIDAAGEELARFKKDMGRPAVKIGLNNSKGARKQPRNKVTKMGKFSEAALDVRKDTAEADKQEDKRKRTGPQPKGSVGPKFVDFSFTNRLSVVTSAFKAAGIDPDRGRTLPAQQQINILRRVIKDRYGIEVSLPKRKIMKKSKVTGRKRVVERTRIQDRLAIDQLLDAYRQLEMMAHAFGVPHGGLGLKHPKTGEAITLSLDETLPGALGQYSYNVETQGDRVIKLPGRSNSFAHEWAHAMDHWLAMHLYQGDVKQMLSVEAQTQGIDPFHSQSYRTGVVFADLMHALFGDRAKLAALQIELQLKAANGNANEAAKAKKVMASLKAGKKLPKDLMNRYFETSKEFGDMYGKGGYFTNPAEMLARAFEAYIGVKVAQISDLPVGFLSKGDWAYESSDETRAAMTFPRGADQVAVMNAFDRLGNAIRTSGILGSKERAAKPDDSGALDLRRLDEYVPPHSLWKQEADDIKQWLRREERKITKQSKDPRDVKDMFGWYADTLRGYARGIVERQPEGAQKPLRDILDLFMDEPGSGRDRSVKAHDGKMIYRPWEDDVETVYRIYVNRLDNIVRKYELGGMTLEETADLRRTLTDDTGRYVPKTKMVKEAAPQLRAIMDDLWLYMNESGVDIGYTKNGYLPRIPDMAAIQTDATGFMAAAKEVYEIEFSNEVRDGDVDEQIEDLQKLIKWMTNYKDVNTNGDQITRNLLTPEQSAIAEKWKKALKALRKAERKGGDTEAAMEKFMAAHEEALDAMEDAYSSAQAEAWHTKMGIGSAVDYEARGPRKSFTEKRTLPPEADRIMQKYYEQDPLTLMYDYIAKAPRRAEYVRRVGPNSELIENKILAAKKAGASAAYIKEIRSMISLMTGREGGFRHSQSQTVGGWIYVGSTMFLLKRAVYSSLAEPLTAGVRLRDWKQSVRAMTSLVGQVMRTGSAQQRMELARAIGLVTSAQHESLMVNRFGGDIDPSQLQGKALGNFFKYTMLTPLTSMQRMSMLAVSQQAIRTMLNRSVKNGNKSSGKSAIRELQDLGIPKEHHADILAWLDEFEEGFPTAYDLRNETGRFKGLGQELWATANVKLVDQIIQNPRRYSRPGAALDSGIKAMYGITGFIYSFHSNVMLPLLKYDIDMNKGTTKADYARYLGRRTWGTGKNALQAFPSMAALMSGGAIAYLIRLAMTDEERLEKLLALDDEAFWDEMMKQAVTRSGVLGAWDIPYNMLTGVKFDRDLAGYYAGPHRAVPLQHLEEILGPIVKRNNANNNTTEHRSMNAALDLMIGAGVPLALSLMPANSPIGAAGKFALQTGIDRLDLPEGITDATLGERKTKHQANTMTPWWEMGDGILAR